MKHERLSTALSFALLMGGCPHRPATTRVVYVPSPPPPAITSTSADTTETMVIEEPAPPVVPKEAAPVEAPESTPPRRPRRVTPVEPSAATPEPTPQHTEVPPLEPRGTPQQQAALRRQIQELQQSLQRRIGQLDQARLSAADHKTLEDAGTFLGQSGKAFEEGDLQRSWVLAQKASLLVAALDRGH